MTDQAPSVLHSLCLADPFNDGFPWAGGRTASLLHEVLMATRGLSASA